MQKEQNVAIFSSKPNPAGGLIELQAAALEATANAVVITDQTGTVIWVNSAFEKLTGYTAAEIMGRTTRVLKSGQNSRVVYEEMWRTILGGRVWRGELINRRKDGSLYDEEMTITPVQDAGGQITHYIAIKLDITARKRSEEHTHRLTQAIESSSELIAMANPDGHFVFANQAFLHTLGYSKEELVGKHFSVIVSPNNSVELLAEFGAQRVKPGGYRGECLLVRRNGADLLASLNIGPVMNEAGQVVGTFGISEDITERKRAEEALRRSEARARRLVESSIIGISIGTLDGKLLDANDAWFKLLGYTHEEMLSGTLRLDRMTPPEYHEIDQRAVDQLTKTGVALPSEKEFIRKDGSRVAVLIGVVTLESEQGDIEALSFVVDLSERKQLEQQLQKAQKMEAIGQLAGGIAHDFNNLLSVIIGYSEILLGSTGLDAKMHGQCEEIKRAGNRAASLTRQLLAFSRQQVLTPTVLNLNIVVVETEKMLRRLIGEEIELRTALDPTLGSVKVDPGQVEQIIMNLAVNARDAMPGGGKLVIETSNTDLDDEYAAHHPPFIAGRYVLLAVTDTGIGMDEGTKTHIFEPFFTTKEIGKGTGLGLSTVYGVVKQSGGYVWVYSELGHGSVFKIYLPRVDQPVQQHRPNELAPEIHGGTETVLLVEDEESVRTLTRSLLEEGGYTVLEASSGTHALEVAGRYSGTIRLLLTDVVMPGMNGRELAQKMIANYPAMTVVYTSGYTGSFSSHGDLFDPGATLIQKPFSRTTLLRKVRDALDFQKESEPVYKH